MPHLTRQQEKAIFAKKGNLPIRSSVNPIIISKVKKLNLIAPKGFKVIVNKDEQGKIKERPFKVFTPSSEIFNSFTAKSVKRLFKRKDIVILKK